ncbi:MAG: hypothetical protein ACXIUL_00455 [Wenzhouxiangella sp.]
MLSLISPLFRLLVCALLVGWLSSGAATQFGWDPDACGGSLPTLPVGDYSLDIQPIFDQHCVQCHQPGTDTFEAVGLDLRPGESYWSLMFRRSVQKPDRWLVFPTTNLHYLLEKVSCNSPAVGARMPPGGPFLSNEQWRLLNGWRLNGALPGKQSTRQVASQAGLTGSWFNPETNGQGMVIEMIMQDEIPIPRPLVYWFTFNDDPDDSQQRWYYGSGRMFSEGGAVFLYRSTGGVLDRPEPETELDQVGRAVIRFESCTEAIFAYYLDPEEEGGAARTGEIPLRRLSPIEFCED